ncbi:MAG: ATP-binding cassette domain-containing protein [Geobacter sp.]|nr:ATP-binding cassette domain-containing protein [Geobacter sp.]
MTDMSVDIRSVSKWYGSLAAVDRFSLEARQGSIFGLLGPNGAGKTTLIRILTTLIRPTTGEAFIEGCSVLSEAKKVRALIGVVPQENNLDRYLTARENLELHARMHGMRSADYRRQVDALLELTGLANRQHEFPDTFSGGMQRRLVVARALVHRPRVLFLDEPTTGLDPQSRRAVWDYVRDLQREMTIFLTTHYMDEADALCDRIVIMDKGRILEDGSAGELKERFAHAHGYELQFRTGLDRYAELLGRLPFVTSLVRNGEALRVTLRGEEFLKPLLDAVGTDDLKGVCLREPSLEDVFIELTGREVRE